MTAKHAITIRPAEASDIVPLARLAAATFTETFGHLYQPKDLQTFLETSRSAERYRRMFEDARMRLWIAVAAEEEEPIGYVVAGRCKLPVTDLEPTAGEVQELYVRSEYHGREIGTRLLTTALDWLASENYAPLYVGVWSENFGAQRLYGRFGFSKVGEYDFPVGEHLDREFILKRP
jgi:ribosomal protein S18 acetylase RimI-like enzyme